jgi:hypothetical protein
MKCWNGLECKIRMKDPDTRQQLRLKMERTSDEFDRLRGHEMDLTGRLLDWNS